MSHPAETTLSGVVTDIFAHRFVIETETGRWLADLGPHGARQVALHKGDRVVAWGDMRPSEMKVRQIAKDGGPSIVVGHEGPHPHEHDDVDPGPALKTAAANGFAVLGLPRRKPKHFEILGRSAAGALVELHLELDGMFRKARPVDGADVKWAAEIRDDAGATGPMSP